VEAGGPEPCGNRFDNSGSLKLGFKLINKFEPSKRYPRVKWSPIHAGLMLRRSDPPVAVTPLWS